MGWATGRHALITGAGTGIGAATARALAAAGAAVSLLGRRPDPLDALAAEIGPAASVHPCDVTDRDALGAAYAAARAAHGPLDFVILNAGIADSAPFARTDPASFDRIIATNLTAAFDGARLAFPDLGTGADKRLVFVASVAGLRGTPLAAPYAASKHGVIGLMKSLALEFARTGLTVNAVCPGFVDTPMTDQSAARIQSKTGRSEDEARAALASLNPSGRLVTPDEVAAAIAYLCLPTSGSTTGAALTIDGGAAA